MTKKKDKNSGMAKGIKRKAKLATFGPNQKRARSTINGNASGSRKMRKQTVEFVHTRRQVVVEDESEAIRLTCGQDDPRPNRRLNNFIFHDADGEPQPVEMLEVKSLFTSGCILPLEESSDKEKERGVRCECFGRIESWAISGYDEGSPVIWISTEVADYECVNPAKGYKMLYNLFFEKARSCIEVYTKLSKACGGNPDLDLHELLAQVVQSMSDSKNFSNGTEVKDFIISQGEFIYNELIGLDETSGNNYLFRDLPVLATLRDDAKKHRHFVLPKATVSDVVLNRSDISGDGEKINQYRSSASCTQEEEDLKLVRLLQEQENRRSTRQTKGIAKEIDGATSEPNQKRTRSTSNGNASASGKMQKRAVASVDSKKQVVAKHEVEAVSLTCEQDDHRPNRRLTNFIFHDADGKPQPVEMLEVKVLFVSGLILPLEESCDKEKEKGVRCQGFGHIESWAISGYEEGSPIVWISTEVADYDCVNPAKEYDKLHNVFFEKARACVEVYMKLSRTCGGNPDLSLDELLVQVVQSMSSSSKSFAHSAAIKDFIVSHGEFIYRELIGLDKSSMDDDRLFSDLPVLAALRDDAKKHRHFVPLKATTLDEVLNTSLKIGGREQISRSSSSTVDSEEDEDVKPSTLLQEEENWRSTIQKKVEHEVEAINLTCGQEDDPQPNRRLTDFIFHDADGKPQPVEMLEFDVLFTSGLILPLEESSEKEKERGVRCEGFGRIESWAISGYEEGSPVIWISTDVADYECVKPAKGYKMLYNLFFEKAHACIEVYMKLSRTCGWNPNLSFDELLAQVVQSMSKSKNFSHESEIKDFIISQGEFIYNELIGLDETSNDFMFRDLPVMAALADEAKKRRHSLPSKVTTSDSSACDDEEEEDGKLARLLQDQESWQPTKQKKGQRQANSSNKFYVKIHEDDINTQETDELPRSMLQNWSLYNSYSQLISLELLPMKPCSDFNFTIFGSGTMTAGDGSESSLDGDPSQPSSTFDGVQNLDGVPVFLSTIKEWRIEFESSMIFVSIRTDIGWYRLGKPSKQYAPWYEPVLKTARLGISIILLLKEQSRVSRLSFADVIKRLSQFRKDHPAYISPDPAEVLRYVVVHGQILLQQFAQYPDDAIKRCAFITSLGDKMEGRNHTKWLMKKRMVLNKAVKLNPRAETAATPLISKTKAMPATTTRLINRIWGQYYSNESPEDSQEADVQWDGESIGSTCSGNALYRGAVVCGHLVTVGGSVLVEMEDSDECPPIYFVEYMFENSDGRKMFHGRLMLRGFQTVIGNTANEREVFLTNECQEFELSDIIETIYVEIRTRPWGYQHRKANAQEAQIDRERARERKRKRLPTEYYCKSLYWPKRGAFFSLPTSTMGLASGLCHSCITKETEREKEIFKMDLSLSSFTYKGIEYSVHDFVYLAPHHFAADERDHNRIKGGRNVGLKAYVVCHLLEIEVLDASKQACPESTNVKVRRLFRPEDISTEKAYCSDIREVYYSEQILTVPVVVIEGKCEVRKEQDLPSLDGPVILEHIFFCEHLYDPDTGRIEQLPCHVKLGSLKQKVVGDAANIEKGKSKGDNEFDNINASTDTLHKSRLATLDIFAGCGGLSEGLQRAGVSLTKWAIEYEEPAGEAFNLNHPEALMFINNCNVILRAIMSACGDADDCVSTSEAAELAAKLDEKVISNLPRPGQVEFINGGPPCQGFSGMNRFNQSSWSKVQCEMILAYLSFADYFRPRFFLLENVRNFVSFDKGKTFRLTLALLLEMGYQVRFGILEAGAYGVPQSRKRVFIWAASPEETLPEWPEPMHVFAGPELKVTLSGSTQYAAVRSTANGAPFRAITVRDAIGDLPVVGNGASTVTMEYDKEPVSWFQKKIQGDMMVLNDHISKAMNEINLIRCQRIPKRPGADWRDLPDEKVQLSTGQVVHLIPWWLLNTAKRHNQWKGIFGRLDWEGNFSTSITDPQPMGKVGMCFHPDQDRILTVRECARSQGFPDSYKFAGNILHKHRQVGNAVPPPLSFALGRKLKEAVERKHSMEPV